MYFKYMFVSVCVSVPLFHYVIYCQQKCYQTFLIWNYIHEDGKHRKRLAFYKSFD